jgi:molybdate transport system permease protein
LLLSFLVLPLVGLLIRVGSTGGFLEALGRPIVAEALKLSLGTTSVVLVITVLLGTPLAFVLARYRFPGASIIDTLVDLPIVLPPAVAGVALLVTLGRRGVLGGTLSGFGIEIPFTTAAVVIAELFVAAPFYVRAARASFLTTPPALEEAAAVFRSSPWQIFRDVTLPLARPGLVAGAVLCWARALGEFGATIMFAGSFQGRTQTMPLAIYAALESDLDAALAISVLLLLLSFVLLLAFRQRGQSDSGVGW